MCLHGIHSWYPLISAWQYRYIHTVNSSILHEWHQAQHAHWRHPNNFRTTQHYPLTILAACIPFNYWQKNPVQYFSKEYRISINKELRVMVKLYVSLDHYLYTIWPHSSFINSPIRPSFWYKGWVLHKDNALHNEIISHLFFCRLTFGLNDKKIWLRALPQILFASSS